MEGLDDDQMVLIDHISMRYEPQKNLMNQISIIQPLPNRAVRLNDRRHESMNQLLLTVMEMVYLILMRIIHHDVCLLQKKMSELNSTDNSLLDLILYEGHQTYETDL